jgi:TnpA family transposase
LQLKDDDPYHFISGIQWRNIRKKTNILGRSKGENMPRQQILTPAEFLEFETPPVFTSVERKRFFYLSQPVLERIATLRTPINQIGFVLTVGYFKATQRFFARQANSSTIGNCGQVRQFHEADASYVAKQLGFLAEVFDLDSYDEATFRRHRKLILDNLGFQPFNASAKQYLRKEIHTMVRSQVRAKGILMQLVDLLARRKTEIPTAYQLTDLIVREILAHKRTLAKVIEEKMTPQLHELLDALLEKKEAQVPEVPQVKRFKLTLLKKISQSTRPLKIKETLSDWQTVKSLYHQLADVIAELDLTHEGLRYYANSVLKSRAFQISQRASLDRHLHLVCFIAHQFYRLQDTLIDILLTVVQNALNTSQRLHKEQYYAARGDQRSQVHDFVEQVDSGAITPMNAIETIAFSEAMSDTEKVERIQDVLTDNKTQRDAACQQLTAMKNQAQRDGTDADYYQVLAAQSRKLQNRVSEMIKSLSFEGERKSGLMVAIQYYKEEDGGIGQTAPLGFLEPTEQQAVLDENGAIRIPLYKVQLFVKIAQAIKGGVLNLKHSYKYRSLDDYLIPQADFLADRKTILQRASLTAVADCKPTLDALKNELDEQYHRTNRRINTEKNPSVHFRKDGSLYVTTPKTEEQDNDPLVSFFPKRRYISLLEVLATVNRFTHFLDSFQPWRVNHTRAKPPSATFFAGIIGYGCSIGTQKMATISAGITESELETTVNGYFTLDNIHAANDGIISFMDGLALPEVYRRPDGQMHTSSDGLTFEVSEDSLHANYSFKYFGADKGVSAYTFRDMRDFLYHSLIISTAEHEAHYVIDGLMHNDVVKSDIHSTDTGGYSEILFGAMHLLGFAFAPRIKNFTKSRLYAFNKRKVYQHLGYRVLPQAYINETLIVDQWDEILRFIATIQLKEATASQLFKRLNSYSRQHPLYQALKEFGKIIKSDFLLRYIDIVELRQVIEKQLNKGESVNKFSRALAFGNNQEFLSGEKVEQEIADSCRRLIQNAIICWNYLYLTQKIAEAESEEERQELLTAIRNGSVARWQHVNLHGEYDFSEEKLSDSVGLQFPKILAYKGG